MSVNALRSPGLDTNYPDYFYNRSDVKIDENLEIHKSSHSSPKTLQRPQKEVEHSESYSLDQNEHNMDYNGVARWREARTLLTRCKDGGGGRAGDARQKQQITPAADNDDVHRHAAHKLNHPPFSAVPYGQAFFNPSDKMAGRSLKAGNKFRNRLDPTDELVPPDLILKSSSSGVKGGKALGRQYRYTACPGVQHRSTDQSRPTTLTIVCVLTALTVALIVDIATPNAANYTGQIQKSLQ
ncbi:hypothetical protein J6590_034038 [Homalodisca vitripennis]|nr:hypothetical protein J6590_034038 [Homalodisca vitripennis]